MSRLLRVFSIFSSIQGESTYAGLPCTFIRLAGCPLNCIYCDTQAACESQGTELSVESIISKCREFGNSLVEVTGGEPLDQYAAIELLSGLCDADFEVLLETSGAFSISEVDDRVIVVLDIKTPGSGMSERNILTNLDGSFGGKVEVKFVITSKEDFDWAVEITKRLDLLRRFPVLLSPADGFFKKDLLADCILKCGLPLRMQVQLHKVVWPHSAGER